MKKYKITFTGLIIALLTYVLIVVSDAELFETFANLLWKFEEYELDELFIPLSILGIFAYIDLHRRHRNQTIEIEKRKIYNAMLSSSHHVLNNFINQMQLFRMSAEETEGFSPEELALYDAVIDEAEEKVNALSAIRSIDEDSIRTSVHPDSFNK